MSPLLTWVFSILAAVMLFLHGLAAFSEEMARLGGERLRDALRRLTRTDWRGALVGAVATAVVQSSAVVSRLAVLAVSQGSGPDYE
jgi:phosphate:Na+ symporter